MNTIRVIVATHKVYEMPKDEMYLPVHVGAAGKESIGYQRDDEGENISKLNPYFCELTGFYWAWKNLDEDYIGLVHYRRLFEMDGRIVEKKQIEQYLGKVIVFVPKKRRYWIESLKTHYDHTHYPEHLEVTRDVVVRKYPEYEKAYDKAVNRTWGYMFNMMIIERGLMDDYCQWLFNILFDIFEKIDTTDYPSFKKRYVGRMSEILFNVWLEYIWGTGEIQGNEVMELNCNVEENWFVKIPAFLKAKFLGKKYEGSF